MNFFIRQFDFLIRRLLSAFLLSICFAAFCFADISVKEVQIHELRSTIIDWSYEADNFYRIQPWVLIYDDYHSVGKYLFNLQSGVIPVENTENVKFIVATFEEQTIAIAYLVESEALIELHALMTYPERIANPKNSIKGGPTAIVQRLKKRGKPIDIKALVSAVTFYEKLGFRTRSVLNRYSKTIDMRFDPNY